MVRAPTEFLDGDMELHLVFHPKARHHGRLSADLVSKPQLADAITKQIWPAQNWTRAANCSRRIVVPS